MPDDRDQILDVFRNQPPPEEQRLADGRQRFADISSRAYEHPLDRAALTALRKVPAFDTIVKGMFGTVSERSLRLLHLANTVKVSDRQFTRVNGLVEACCDIFDLDERPDVFVAQRPVVNAGAMGLDRPFVVLNSGTLELYDDDELRHVIGHEMAHVLSGHALYKTMVNIMLRYMVPIVARLSLPVAGLAIRGIVMALLEWNRKSELSADRAGVLCTQSPETSYRAIMKLAGGGEIDQMNVDAFIDQAREYEADGDARDSAIKLMNLVGQSHPFPVLRLAELKKWVDAGEYDRILSGDYPKRSEDDDASVKEDAARGAQSWKTAWSESEDPLAKMMESVTGAGNQVWSQIRGWLGRGDVSGDDAPPTDAGTSSDAAPSSDEGSSSDEESSSDEGSSREE